MINEDLACEAFVISGQGPLLVSPASINGRPHKEPTPNRLTNLPEPLLMF